MKYLLNEIPVLTTSEQVLKRLLIEEEEDQRLVAGLFAKAKDVARPKVLYRESYVERVEGEDVQIDGAAFTSRVLAMNLQNVHRVFAYVATCGTEVDDWTHLEKDYVVILWLDIIKEMILFDAIQYFNWHIKEAYQLEKTAACNPGSGNLENWPLSQQRPLFDLIGDVTEQIGVVLTNEFLMLPTKSTSGLVFPADTEFSNCALCSRENCVGRRAAFDAELHAKAGLTRQAV